MRHKILVTMLTLALALVGAGWAMAATGGPDAYGYTWDDSEPYVWNDISGTGTLVTGGDEVVQSVTLGFNFVFYGKMYTSVSVASNGHVSFNGTTSYTTSCDWSAPAITQFAGKWNDLVTASLGAIYYKIDGTAPDRKLTVQYHNVPLFGADTDLTTFQVVLFEGSNDIVMYFADPLTTAAEAIGINGGSVYLQYACATGAGAANTAVRFTHPTGIFVVSPATETKGGEIGATVTHTVSILNLTGSKATFDITKAGETWTTTVPASLEVNDGELGTFDVTVEIPGTANYGDDDSVTVSVTYDGVTHDSVLTTMAACDIIYDDGTAEGQLGCSKKGPCYMGSVFTSDGPATITSVKVLMTSESSAAPFRVCFYAATVVGGPTGAPLGCFGPFTSNNLDDWYTAVLSTPQSVNGDFAVILDQTSGFLSIGRDEGSDVGRAWVSTDDGASFDPIASIGYPSNFMIRASTCEIIDDDDDDDDDNDDNDTSDDDTGDDDTGDDDTGDDDTGDDDASDDDAADDDATDDDASGDDDDDDDSGCGC